MIPPPQQQRITSMFFLLLKLGALVNLYFLLQLRSSAPPQITIPATIFFLVDAYRCLFPVRYEHNVVYHDSIFSSIFITRFLATFSEIAYIFQFSHVIRFLNVSQIYWINLFSYFMVAHAIVAQFFVWSAILGGQTRLYFFEEMNWAFIFLENSIASAWLWVISDASSIGISLLRLNLVFGLLYLPWQALHLRMLWQESRKNDGLDRHEVEISGGIVERFRKGLMRSIFTKNKRTDLESWGGFVGLSWMIGYWASLIPAWIFYISRVFSS